MPGHRERRGRPSEEGHQAAPQVGVNVVNTFIGRDGPTAVEDNWPRFAGLAGRSFDHAEQCGVTHRHRELPDALHARRVARRQEPAQCRRRSGDDVREYSSTNFGLNFDPSHLIWQHIDYVRCLRDFGKRIVHVHAKDTRIDEDGCTSRQVWASAGTRRSCRASATWTGALLLGADRHRLPWPGLHRGRGSSV